MAYVDPYFHNTAAKEFQAMASIDQHLHNTAAKEFQAVLYKDPHPYNTAAKEFRCGGVFSPAPVCHTRRLIPFSA